MSRRKQHTGKQHIKSRLIISAIILLILALGFNALLSLNSLEKLYVESIASQYSAVGKDLQRNIEKSLRFGKPIEKFVGMDKFLEETRDNLLKKIGNDSRTVNSAEISVSISLPDGSLLYSTNEMLVGTALPEKVTVSYSADSSSPEVSYLKYDGAYITPLPIRDMKKNWVATVLIMFDQSQVKNLLDRIRSHDIQLISFILLGSIALLILLLSLVSPATFRMDIFPKWRISLVMFLVIISAQAVFSVLNVTAFKDYYIQINREKNTMLVTLLKEDVEFFLSKGLRINKLVKMDVLLGEILADSPELRNIAILDNTETPLYMASKDGVVDFQQASEEERKQAQELLQHPDPQYNFRMNLVKNERVEGQISANADAEGYISTNLSKEIIQKKLFEIGLDSATVLVISMLFFGELLILIFQFIENKAIDAKSLRIVHYEIIRPAGFVFYFGLNMSVSFIPLYMETLYEPILGLSKDLVMGLPISVTMFSAGIAIFLAGIWVDRRGWFEAFFAGILLTGLGFLGSWLALNALSFIAARGFVGLGYGFTMMAAQGFVIAYTDEHTKAQGLTRLDAGFYAGFICGSSAGAMLAQRVGYSPVFLIGAIILFSTLIYAAFFLRHAVRKPVAHAVHTSKRPERLHVGQYFRFLFHRNILVLSVFIIFPSAMLTVGFLYYLIPVYLNRIGTSQSNIGRLLMAHGLFFIYVAPLLSKYIDRSENKKWFIVASGLLGSLAFIAFYVFDGFTSSIVAVFLLGLAGSINASNAYALRLKAAQTFGSGKALSMLSTVDRSGQVLGPLVFGWILVSMELNRGVTYLGLGFLAVTFLFSLSAQGLKREARKFSK